MAYEIFCNTSKLLVREEKTLHDLLHIIGPIVQRHEGIMELSSISQTIDIILPHNEEAVCARKIQESLGAISK